MVWKCSKHCGGTDMKQFDLTVTIRVTVPDRGNVAEQLEEAEFIAQQYAQMALKYKSIGADEILRVDVEEAQ
jgi:hypothetical protein